MINVENFNKTFSKYPITIEDKGWIYGVWYCGTSFQKIKMHGQYPPTFLKRALSLFPDAKKILHCPSGTLSGLPKGHMTVDAVKDSVRRPRKVADVSNLPFIARTFDLVLSDPPYTKKDSKIYGCDPWPMNKAMSEFRRVLRTGGHLGMLHTYYPMYKSREWKLEGLIAVVTGFCRATRMFSIFRKK